MFPSMGQSASIKEYAFHGADEERGYRLFPNELENDEHVFFHGTAEANLRSIIANGFRIPDGLKSISFARDSSVPLKYACDARTTASPNGCVLAVRFESLDKPEIVHEQFGIHVYKFDPPPVVIGYCIVPADYMFR
jgi:hypothetical protein